MGPKSQSWIDPGAPREAVLGALLSGNRPLLASGHTERDSLRSRDSFGFLITAVFA